MTDSQKISGNDRMLVKYFHSQQADQQMQHITVQAFWERIRSEISHLSSETVDPTNSRIPLNHVFREMRSELQNVPEPYNNMYITADATISMAKLTEMFILELTLRSWMNGNDSSRLNLTVQDVMSAIENTDNYDLFLDALPNTNSPRVKREVSSNSAGNSSGSGTTSTNGVV